MNEIMQDIIMNFTEQEEEMHRMALVKELTKIYDIPFETYSNRELVDWVKENDIIVVKDGGEINYDCDFDSVSCKATATMRFSPIEIKLYKRIGGK